MQTMFFATFADLEPILKDVEKAYGIHYFQMGLLDVPETIHCNSIFENPDVGFISKGDWNYDRRFLVMPKELSLQVREVRQVTGRIKYAIDPTMNADSVCLQFGGIYRQKENVLVAGKIATIMEEPFSLAFYKLFSKKIQKGFKRIGAFYVGKEAEEKLHAGWRLVQDERRKPEYDLRIEE
jgi:hypothetical protein